MKPIQTTAAPEALAPNPWNTNVVSPDNEAKLDESVRRFGMFKPIVVRERTDGRLEILGGEHRVAAAVRVGLSTIPIINLGKIDDKRAKEISLVDNGRYGQDNALQLAGLLEELGAVEDLATFMPYSETDIASIFSSVNIALEDLDIPDADEPAPSLPKDKPVQTHQVMRFKVPVEDSKWLSSLIEKTAKVQKFTDSDSLTNAGDALVFLLKQAEAI